MLDYEVKSIDAKQTYEWLLYKHYVHRLPMAIEYSFGLFSNNNLCGVCTLGPTAPPVPITLFGEVGKFTVRELTRLVVNDNLKKNALSYFVSTLLKMMPKSMCIISFADKSKGHHGYIYQATNFIYTGEGGEKYNYIDSNNNPLHSLTVNDRAKIENLNQRDYLNKHNIKKIIAEPK